MVILLYPRRDPSGVLPIERDPIALANMLEGEWGTMYLSCQFAMAVCPGPTPGGSLCK